MIDIQKSVVVAGAALALSALGACAGEETYVESPGHAGYEYEGEPVDADVNVDLDEQNTIRENDVHERKYENVDEHENVNEQKNVDEYRR